ncbi:MAG: hypothetical protein BWX88_04378 [Planctomycetes bacterium ADurb.Bin126]|nr:MAG: hypothetical protein BWX88_04378 [Planctomycetes bacterium ADurb.Bin126]HOD82902.1 hypothetical protein [Phycisphaerae bacterium]HQL73754.1 hypothetical protein [Phycisphaerae bacterium]
MKKKPEDDDMLPEYDLSGGVRGKYAARYAEGTNVVLLDPDVHEAFPDSRQVNQVLRKVMQLCRERTVAELVDVAGSKQGKEQTYGRRRKQTG